MTLETHPEIYTNPDAGASLFQTYFENLNLIDFNIEFYNKFKNISSIYSKQSINFSEFKDFITQVSDLGTEIEKLEALDPKKTKLLIRQFNEDVLGGCRVFVMFRDDNINPSTEYKNKADTILKRVGIKKYTYMNDCENGCKITLQNEGLISSQNQLDKKEYIFGPFTQVFTEEESTNHLFERGFQNNEDFKMMNGQQRGVETTSKDEEGELLSSLRNGNSLILFGFGFSGSGKTYQLISPKNRSDGKYQHILARILNHFKETKSLSKVNVKVSELYPYVDGDVRDINTDVGIENDPHITTDLLERELVNIW